jgi:hypothetical protein
VPVLPGPGTGWHVHRPERLHGWFFDSGPVFPCRDSDELGEIGSLMITTVWTARWKMFVGKSQTVILTPYIGKIQYARWEEGAPHAVAVGCKCFIIPVGKFTLRSIVFNCLSCSITKHALYTVYAVMAYCVRRSCLPSGFHESTSGVLGDVFATQSTNRRFFIF